MLMQRYRPYRGHRTPLSHDRLFHYVSWRTTLFLVSLAVFVFEAALFLAPLPQVLQSPTASRQVLAKDGSLLFAPVLPGLTRAFPAPLNSLGIHVAAATVHGEDHRFYTHCGVDLLAVVRAVWLNLRAGGVVYGASTLSMQLARLALRHGEGAHVNERPLRRKLQETWLALAMERQMSKDEILEAYLNMAPYGGVLQGVEAASQGYFGKPASVLSLGEASLLAVIPRSPRRYALRLGLADALIRRAHVLELMRARGAITNEQLSSALDEPAVLAVPQLPRALHADTRILAQVGHGSAVLTTLDMSLQARAEVLVSETVRGLTARGGHQAAALVVETKTAKVRAYVGSANIWDPTTQGHVDGVNARRSPGSALKPLLYAAALDAGFTPATLLSDVDQSFQAPRGVYRPQNYDRRVHGLIRLREALANSYNIAAVDIASRLGPHALLDVLSGFGLHAGGRDADELGLGVILGGMEVSLWDLAGAYLTLARGGRRFELRLMDNAEVCADGSCPNVVSPQAAYLVTRMLQDDNARAAAFGRHSTLHLPFEAAVKTGTSKDFRDNWAVGFSTRYLVAVWVGDFEGRPMKGVSGISGAGVLWHKLMRSTHANKDPEPLTRVEDITEARICTLSGAAQGPHCSTTLVEEFRAGTEPHAPCSLHTPGGLVLPPQFLSWSQTVGWEAQPAQEAVRVNFPPHGAQYRIHPDRTEDGSGLVLLASAPKGEVEIWLDGDFLVRGVGHVRAAWKATPGRHVVEAVHGVDRDRAQFDVME
jgi:penicillin-binding protein 1C